MHCLVAVFHFAFFIVVTLMIFASVTTYSNVYQLCLLVVAAILSLLPHPVINAAWFWYEMVVATEMDAEELVEKEPVVEPTVEEKRSLDELYEINTQSDDLFADMPIGYIPDPESGELMKIGGVPPAGGFDFERHASMFGPGAVEAQSHAAFVFDMFDDLEKSKYVQKEGPDVEESKEFGGEDDTRLAAALAAFHDDEADGRHVEAFLRMNEEVDNAPAASDPVMSPSKRRMSSVVEQSSPSHAIRSILSEYHSPHRRSVFEAPPAMVSAFANYSALDSDEKDDGSADDDEDAAAANVGIALSRTGDFEFPSASDALRKPDPSMAAIQDAMAAFQLLDSSEEDESGGNNMFGSAKISGGGTSGGGLTEPIPGAVFDMFDELDSRHENEGDVGGYGESLVYSSSNAKPFSGGGRQVLPPLEHAPQLPPGRPASGPVWRERPSNLPPLPTRKVDPGLLKKYFYDSMPDLDSMPAPPTVLKNISRPDSAVDSECDRPQEHEASTGAKMYFLDFVLRDEEAETMSVASFARPG